MKKLFAIAFMFAGSFGMSGCWDTCDGSCYYDYYYDSWHDDYYYGWNDPHPWDDPWYGGCDSCSGCSGGCSHGCSSNNCSSNNNAVDPNGSYNQSPAQNPDACLRNSDCESGLCVNSVCMALPDDPVNAECTSNADCGSDMLCTEGRCIPCQTDVCDTSKEIECVFSSQCESGLCVDGVCLIPGACAIDSNCREGQICLDGACIARPECLSDAECGDGKICNASNECEDDVECHVDADCGEGMLCLSNMCAQCRLNCECPNDGDICMNGACISSR